MHAVAWKSFPRDAVPATNNDNTRAAPIVSRWCCPFSLGLRLKHRELALHERVALLLDVEPVFGLQIGFFLVEKVR